MSELVNMLRVAGHNETFATGELYLAAANRIEALEAEVKMQQRNEWGLTTTEAMMENIELQAKLDAVEQLPALWKRRMARPWQPCAQPDRFISDLTEALQEQEDDLGI